MNMIGIIGTLITAGSFIYAIYENRRHAKLINYNREQAWEIYRQVSRVLFYYQELENSNINDKNIFATVSKGEIVAQELIVSSMHMIKRFEKKYDFDSIDTWSKQGKIPNESHVKAFKSLI